MEPEQFCDLVQRWARAMNYVLVADRWIFEALARPDQWEATFPNGMPSPRAIYNLAIQLEGEAASKH